MVALDQLWISLLGKVAEYIYRSSYVSSGDEGWVGAGRGRQCLGRRLRLTLWCLSVGL